MSEPFQGQQDQQGQQLAPREAPIYLHQHTRREFRTRIGNGEITLGILPVAAIEQHLEHLAMEHDWRSVNVVAERVASNLRPHAVIAQGVMVGISEHHMRHAGSLSLRPGTFLSVVHDLIHSLVRAGLRNILVLNGHGGNIAPVRGMWDQWLREYQVNLHFLPYWDVLDEEDARLLRSRDVPGHAQEFETAIAWTAFPENIRFDALADQQDQSPAWAKAEVGRELLDRIVRRVTDYGADMLAGRRQAKIPDYFP